MAIQFHCPYCTATIQVPDHAAGKKGTCPQCRTKLIVPIPQQPQPAGHAPSQPFPSAPQFAPNVPAAQAAAPTWFVPQPGGAPMMPGPAMPPGYAPAPMPGYPPAGYPAQPPMLGQGLPLYDPSYAPPIPAPAAHPEQEVSRPIRSRARRRSSNGALIGGVIAVVALVGAGLAFVYFKPGKKADLLQGELIAMRRDIGKLEPALVHREWINLDEEIVSAVLKQMEKSTIKLRTDRMDLRFQGVPEGIKVAIGPGPSGVLIAVETKQHPGLSAWAAREAPKLTDKHQKGVIQAATRFVKEWAMAESRGEKKKDIGAFHDELGLASLTQGLGSEVIAVVGETIFPCIAEQQGQLFFLLPPGTERFELQGREHSNKKTIFPGQFRVTVLVAPATEDSNKKPSDDDGKSDPDKEMERNAFGRPALNDPSVTGDSPPSKTKAKPADPDQ